MTNVTANNQIKMQKQLAVQFDEIANLPEKGDVWTSGGLGSSSLGRSIASSQNRGTRLNKKALGELTEDMKEDLFPIDSMSQFNSTQ
jgi:hypothetical protein